MTEPNRDDDLILSRLDDIDRRLTRLEKIWPIAAAIALVGSSALAKWLGIELPTLG